MNETDKLFTLAAREVLFKMMTEERDLSRALARYCAAVFGPVFVSQEMALRNKGYTPEKIAEHLFTTAKVMKDYIDRSARITAESDNG